MSSIQPITFSSDQALLGRIADPVTRSARGSQIPAVLPPAVILPRTAAWLNAVTITPSESVATTETAPDQDTSSQSASTQDAVAQLSSAAGVGVYAQTNAIQAAATTSAPTSDVSAPGAGSVLQLV